MSTLYSLQKPTSTQYRSCCFHAWELNHPRSHVAGLEPHTNSSSSGGSNRSTRSRVSSLTPSGQSASKVLWFIKIAIWKETSQVAFAIYVCSFWRAYLQKIQVTSGEALDRSHVERADFSPGISNSCLTYQEDWKKLFHHVLVANLYSGKGLYFFLLSLFCITKEINYFSLVFQSQATFNVLK